MNRLPIITFFLVLGLLISACSDSAEGRQIQQTSSFEGNFSQEFPSLDVQLQMVVDEKGISRLYPGPELDPDLVILGRALFFDKILSGNRDIACSTCHHPVNASGDGLPVAIGTGGSGLGERRILGDNRPLIPRNSPEIFNRGLAAWSSMFWDSRVSLNDDGVFISPAGSNLPDGLTNVLAVQAMFPVTSRDEMRGSVQDLDVHGRLNELSLYDDEDLQLIWDGLMARLLSFPEYVELFRAAYPDVPVHELGFQHAANAIAAFEAQAFAMDNSYWDRYLSGSVDSISQDAKQGALLFYGQAGCANCHSGPLFTDQEEHVLATPQVGPGKGELAPLDVGRMQVTGVEADKFAFRTPPLHNVVLSGPWMHDGAYNSLEAVVAHHLDPASSLLQYDPDVHLPAPVRETYRPDEVMAEQMLANIDQLLANVVALSDEQIADLIAFLESLTDPRIFELEGIVPDSVPSGLAVLD